MAKRERRRRRCQEPAGKRCELCERRLRPTDDYRMLVVLGRVLAGGHVACVDALAVHVQEAHGWRYGGDLRWEG